MYTGFVVRNKYAITVQSTTKYHILKCTSNDQGTKQ